MHKHKCHRPSHRRSETPRLPTPHARLGPRRDRPDMARGHDELTMAWARPRPRHGLGLAALGGNDAGAARTGRASCPGAGGLSGRGRDAT